MNDADFDGSPISVPGITDLSPDTPRVRGEGVDGCYSDNGTWWTYWFLWYLGEETIQERR